MDEIRRLIASWNSHLCTQRATPIFVAKGYLPFFSPLHAEGYLEQIGGLGFSIFLTSARRGLPAVSTLAQRGCAFHLCTQRATAYRRMLDAYYLFSPLRAEGYLTPTIWTLPLTLLTSVRRGLPHHLLMQTPIYNSHLCTQRATSISKPMIIPLTSANFSLQSETLYETS